MKFTKTFIDSLKPGEREQWYWDAECIGFGLKVTPTGKKCFYVFYRTISGQQRKPRVGIYGVLTVEQARHKARAWLVAASDGKDPSAERKALRRGETVADLIRDYLEHAKARKKERSYIEDKRNLENHIKPIWGTRKAAAIEGADVARLHHEMRDTPTAANRVRAVLSTMFSFAEVWGMRPKGSNPVKGVKPYKEVKRERYLDAGELARLDEKLTELEAAQLEAPEVCAAIRLLVFTGCRLSEVLNLDWSYVDFEKGCLNLPDSKTGKKTVHLNRPAAELLADRFKARGKSPWVFAMENKKGRLYDLENPWNRIRKKAGLADVRLHDLRHTYGSTGAGLGLGLPQIGKLLGHSRAETTARYSHVAPSPAREAAELIGAALVEAIEGGAKVVQVNAPAETAGLKSKAEGGK